MSLNVALNTLSVAMRRTHAEIAVRSHEVSTGRPKDLAAAIGPGAMDRYAALSRDATLNAALAQAAAESAPRFDAQLTALDRFRGTADALGMALLTREGLPGEAEAALSDMIGALNTSFAGEFLFAGSSSGVAPVPRGSWILDHAKAVFSAAPDEAAGIQAVKDWFFDDAGGYAATVGLMAPASARIADPALADIRLTTAMALPLRTALAGAALAGLSPADGAGGTTRSAAADLLAGGSRSALDLEAGLGLSAERLAHAETLFRDRSEEAGAEQVRMEGVDLFESAVELQRLSQHAELLYSVTARISRLSLADFLK